MCCGVLVWCRFIGLLDCLVLLYWGMLLCVCGSG